MPSPTPHYAPRPLPTAREYPGYQFYARLSYKGRDAAACLSYAALTVQNWLCARISRAGGEVPSALQCPAPDGTDQTGALRGCRLPLGEIVSLPDEGIWALTVREPDPERAGRSFATRVGLKTCGDDGVEFGVCVDVLDHDAALEELDKAYRPQFVRLLFETKGMTLTQVEPLGFRQLMPLQDRRSVERMKALYDDRQNRLPLVIFTPVTERKLPGGIPVPRPTEAAPLLVTPLTPVSLPDASAPPRVVPVLREKKSSRKAARDDVPAPIPVETVERLPYDAEEFARHLYGYAQVCAASAAAVPAVRNKFGKPRLKEGDILILEPRTMGGGARVIAYRPDLSQAYYRDVLSELNESLQSYSKHKTYDFGGVLFVDSALQRQRERELEALRASVRSEKSAELENLLDQLEQERALSADQARYIAELRAQNIAAREEGAEAERKRIAALRARMDQFRADMAGLKAQNEHMSAAFAEVTALRQVAAQAQTIGSMPKTQADVVAYFRQMFADRLDFTDRGAKTAARCDINPETLWEGLYYVATVLADIHRAGYQDVEKRFHERTGWDVAMTETGQTRATTGLMNSRSDVYDGRSITVEPHVKFPDSIKKTGALHRRLYYAYDPVTRKVIVGCVGEHLETFGSLHVH